MSRFYTEVEIDIDIEEFYDDLSFSEVDELIDILVEEGYVIKRSGGANKADSINTSEWLFMKMMDKIISNRLRLTKEEELLLNKIADRF